MASRQIFHAKPSYMYPTPAGIDTAIASESCIFEFDEADLWISSADHLHHQATTVSNMEVRKPIPSSRSSKKLAKKMDLVGDHHHHHHHNNRMPMASASLPVNIPDWSKILKDEYREHNKRESDEEGDDNNNNNNHNHNHNHHHHRDHEEDEYYGLVPPHEYLAMTRGASFSVHEGVGRTLKGRDLRRVRNAIWKKVGFED